MPTITEIRISNLNQLIDEHGSIKALAEAIDRAPSVVSQMRSGRSFGGNISRHTEKALGLPTGYLDSQNIDTEKSIDKLLSQVKQAFEEQTLSLEEKRLINIYRGVSKPKRKLVMGLINELNDKNS